jgi:hypothetical protein
MKNKDTLHLNVEFNLPIKLIDWCLTTNLAVFQLYRGINKYYINLRQLRDP